MSYKQATNAYKNNQVLTASPKKIIDLLLEGAIKQIKLGIHFMEDKNFEAVNEHLIKAQDIILELKLSVDTTVEGEIPDQLIAMYEFMFSRLVQANMEKDVERLELVVTMLEDFRETWNEL
ncbi:flagellar export chaperone FliS [Vagococcus sp.]|uniref:flagellar export chaperone FliS n=1 Tax=Vagococcus sp. TaxID=1933889 RepID=UPI003F9914B3